MDENNRNQNDANKIQRKNSQKSSQRAVENFELNPDEAR